MSLQDEIDEWNMKILTYLSYGGGILSIVGCMISVITFEFFRYFKSGARFDYT